MIIGYFTMFPVIYKNHKVKDFNYILLLYNDTNKQNLVLPPRDIKRGQKRGYYGKYQRNESNCNC